MLRHGQGFLQPNDLLLEKRLPEMKYKCQLCDREIDDFVAIAHIKAEEYLIDLIRRDHPEWKEDKKTCHKCIDYYHRLVRESEI